MQEGKSETSQRNIILLAIIVGSVQNDTKQQRHYLLSRVIVHIRYKWYVRKICRQGKGNTVGGRGPHTASP